MEGSAAVAVESEADRYDVTVSERQSLMGEDIRPGMQDERTALLPGKSGDSTHIVERDAAIIESELKSLPWWKRPSVRNPSDALIRIRMMGPKLIYLMRHSDILDPSAVATVHHSIWRYGGSENKPHTKPCMSKLSR